MHRRTQEALAQVAQAEWYRAVGQPDVEGVSLLSSWDEAIASCSATGWQNLLIEVANCYTDQLAQRSRERFREWNGLVREMKTVTVPLVERKIEPVVREHDLPKVFADTVHWDMLHLATRRVRRCVSTGLLRQPGVLVHPGALPLRLAGPFP